MKVYECGCCHRWYDADRDAGGEPNVASLNVAHTGTGEIEDQPHWRLVCPPCLAALHFQGSAPERGRNVID